MVFDFDLDLRSVPSTEPILDIIPVTTIMATPIGLGPMLDAHSTVECLIGTRSQCRIDMCTQLLLHLCTMLDAHSTVDCIVGTRSQWRIDMCTQLLLHLCTVLDAHSSIDDLVVTSIGMGAIVDLDLV